MKGDLEQLLKRKSLDADVVLATGENLAARKSVSARMRRGAATKGRLVAMCSDSMSEGVNLQEASAVVHLDMPSVVRIAEQRVGRVDRMDSPHASIQVWWPQDAKAFALRTDERFLARYATVESLLGSNLPLPEALGRSAARAAPVTAQDLIAEAENPEAARWDGIQDAFAPVRDLVHGEERLIPADTYRHYRTVTERVLARVSCVRSPDQWALLCFAGTTTGAPRWVLCRADREWVTTDLDEICGELRQRLGRDSKNLDPNEAAMDWLAKAVERVHRKERSLLPRRKQRALEEFEIVLRHYQLECEKRGAHEGAQKLRSIVTALNDDTPDVWMNWDLVAERWLDLIRPVWYEALSGKRRQARPLLLRDVRKQLMHEKPVPLELVFREFLPLPTLQPLDERMAACILGVRE
ncbi:MAG: hypothetical protein HC794_03725 [Nitrospiraceae bacterium]|nr:hypothetical protein [Nitrospiraceae bacterium]